MLKRRFVLTILLALLCSTANVDLFRSAFLPGPVWARSTITQRPVNTLQTNEGMEDEHLALRNRLVGEGVVTNELFSPTVAERFYEIASCLVGSESITEPQAEQAIVLLTAAKQLSDASSRHGNPADTKTSQGNLERVLSLLIQLACENSKRDYSQQMYSWLAEYVNGLADPAVVKKAIAYLLDRCDTREQREQILSQMLTEFGGKNAAIDSELGTSLGLLMLEKADFDTAQSLLVRAYLNDRYNKLAFAKLAEIAPEKISPAIYFEHLRLMLRENPADIEAVLAFARYAESAHGGHLYDIAAAAYQYCVDLFSYLYPNESLPASIYLPWIISNYNSEQNRSKCLQIAVRIRSSGRFDILVEAIAGRSNRRIGYFRLQSLGHKSFFNKAPWQVNRRRILAQHRLHGFTVLRNRMH
jgi:hypothetical protein